MSCLAFGDENRAGPTRVATCNVVLGDLSELVGVYFLFGQDSLPEAERALALVGLDPEDTALRSRLTEYRQGMCLMRDLDGRVGELQVDLVFPELLAALDNTPKAAQA